jgi:hypothetical protein
MQIPTDHIALIQSLGVYSFASTTPAELAGKLQTIPGSTVDRIFTAAEILYAFRDVIEADGLTVLAQLTGYALANHWDFPGKPGRMQAIHDSTMSVLGETTLADDFEQPEPMVTYRTDQKDWRAVMPQNLDVLKAGKRAQVGALLESKFQAGFTPASGPVAGKTMQCRDLEDRTNWLTSQAAYLAAVSGGQGAAMGAAFRTADNSTITCSFSDGLNTLLAMAQWGKELFQKSWSLKDAITAIAVVDTGNPKADLQAAVDALNAIDITSGWPA